MRFLVVKPHIVKQRVNHRGGKSNLKKDGNALIVWLINSYWIKWLLRYGFTEVVRLKILRASSYLILLLRTKALSLLVPPATSISSSVSQLLPSLAVMLSGDNYSKISNRHVLNFYSVLVASENCIWLRHFVPLCCSFGDPLVHSSPWEAVLIFLFAF